MGHAVAQESILSLSLAAESTKRSAARAHCVASGCSASKPCRRIYLVGERTGDLRGVAKVGENSAVGLVRKAADP
eukprot:7260100-Prymnesium_polylepis.1